MFCHIYNLLSNFLFTDQSQYVQYASRILVPHNMEKKRINDKAPNKNRQISQQENSPKLDLVPPSIPLYWYSTIKYQPVPPYTNPVPPYTDPVPPSTKKH